MKLWLDDVRPCPPGWIWCKTVNEAWRWFCDLGGEIEVASLDHDLAGNLTESEDENGHNGMTLMNRLELVHLEGRPYWPKKIIIHSVNPWSSVQMVEVARRYVETVKLPFTGRLEDYDS